MTSLDAENRANDDRTWAFELDDAEATVALGERLASALPARGGFAIALNGPLGAGKSTLVRALLRSLGVNGPVPSPTYTLVEPYMTRRGPACHMDFYRLESGADVQALGVDEVATEEALLLVEWPERGEQAGLSFDLDVSLAHRECGRLVSLHARSEAGAVTLERLRGDA